MTCDIILYSHSRYLLYSLYTSYLALVNFICCMYGRYMISTYTTYLYYLHIIHLNIFVFWTSRVGIVGSTMLGILCVTPHNFSSKFEILIQNLVFIIKIFQNKILRLNLKSNCTLSITK